MEHLDSGLIGQHPLEASGYERLFALAAFVDTLPPHVVTFGCWYRNGIGCVVGLAAKTNAWFQAQGFRLADCDEPQLCHPIYRESADWNAVSEFFGLDVGICRQLFTSAGYGGDMHPEPKRIAARIWEYLEQQGGAGGEAVVGDGAHGHSAMSAVTAVHA